jgi:hypothetical protein
MAKKVAKSDSADPGEELVSELAEIDEAWDVDNEHHVVVDQEIKDLVKECTSLAQRLTRRGRLREGAIMRIASAKHLVELKAILEATKNRRKSRSQDDA